MKRFLLSAILALAAFAPLAHANEPEPSLIGGTPADPKDYPASQYCRMGSAACTCTNVGPRTVLIAAHCVDNGGTARFSVGPNQYSAACTHAPGYRGNSTADWSLCKAERVVTGIKYEDLNTDPDRVKVGTKLLLTGYGCVRPGGGGGNDGVYRVGESTVTQVPSGRSNDIVTKRNAALCYGDSGGPAFLVIGSLRWVVSVNSRGDIATTSYLSSVSTAEAKAFINDWSEKNAEKICGVHAGVADCHNGEDNGGGDGDEEPAPDCKPELADYDAALEASASKYAVLKRCVNGTMQALERQ